MTLETRNTLAFNQHKWPVRMASQEKEENSPNN